MKIFDYLKNLFCIDPIEDIRYIKTTICVERRYISYKNSTSSYGTITDKIHYMGKDGKYLRQSLIFINKDGDCKIENDLFEVRWKNFEYTIVSIGNCYLIKVFDVGLLTCEDGLYVDEVLDKNIDKIIAGDLKLARECKVKIFLSMSDLEKSVIEKVNVGAFVKKTL
jgi:hypothetical protein